jgi:hypothetical protein
MNRFNAQELLADYNDFTNMWERDTPFNLVRPSAMTDTRGIDYGAETLYDHQQGRYTMYQHEFDTNMDYIKGSYTESVMEQMRADIRTDYSLTVGRVRLLALRPKSCLTMHTDIESEIRFHIPIQTNKGAMFVVDYQVQTMWELGMVYRLDVQKPHTAINASREPRVHIVFDAY